MQMASARMDWLQHEIADNEVWRWLFGVGVALATIAAVRLLKSLMKRRLERVAARTRTRMDDVTIEVLGRTRWFFYAAAGIYLGSLALGLEEGVEAVIRVGATLTLLVQIGLWGQCTLRLGVHAWQRRHAPEFDESGQSAMAAGVIFIGQLLLWTLVLLMGLANLGIEISALIAGLGMGGIAAALAVQSVLGDLFASLSIYFDRPFDIGDFIIVGDLMGTVDKIGLRSTRVRSLSGEQLVFSNKDLLESRIRNYKRMAERRVVTLIGLEYGTSATKMERAPELMREAVEEVERLRFDRAHFKRFADYSLELELVYWVLDPDYALFMDLQQKVNLGIMRRFEAEGLRFAFPTRTLHVHHENAPVASGPPADRAPRGNGSGAPARG